MRRAEPEWFGRAAELLAQGVSITDAAKAVSVTREGLSKRLRAPGSSLAAEVRRLQGATTSEAADKSKALFDQAMEVMEKGLTSADEKRAFDAAKIVLARLLPSQTVVRVEEATPEPVTAEDVVREMAAGLVDVAHVIAEGGVSNEAIALISAAAAQVVAALPKPVAAPGAPPAAPVPTNEAPPTPAGADPFRGQRPLH